MTSFKLRIALPIAFILAGSSACRDKPATTLSEDRPPAMPAPSGSGSAGSVALNAASAAAERGAAPEEVPTLYLEPFAPKGTHPRGVFQIEGALAVIEEQRVGRIAGEGIEWSDGKIPKGGPALGDNVLSRVYGRWPDRIDVTYTSSNGRAPTPTYFPLTGKGSSTTVSPGGGLGDILGVVTLGESTVVATWTPWEGDTILAVRGPPLGRRHLGAKQGGCKEGEIKLGTASDPAAIPDARMGATPDGTLMSIGKLCSARGVAAEVWDKAGKQRIVDLGQWVKDVDWNASFVPGKGDELWFVAGEGSPILHYRDGKFEPLPSFGKAELAFLSPNGQLHATDGQTIHRLEEGKWTPIGRVTFPIHVLRTMAFDGEVLWVGALGSVYRLRKGPSTELREGCATPFVYLYEVKAENAKDFTFPATRKAMSTFPGAAELGLVDFYDGARRLGVTVSSKAQGEALVAHVKATMKDENPKLLCYEPKKPRRIELGAKP